MKKTIILTLGLCMGLTLSAAEGNLLKNGGFETKTVTFGELFDKKDITNKLKFALYTYAPTSVSGVVTAVKEAAVVAAGAGAIALAIRNLKKK